MKKIMIFTVLFLFAFTAHVLAFILVRAGNHWHTNWSDGHQTALMAKEFAISENLDVVVFNDHSDMKIRTTPGGYGKYKKGTEGISDNYFISIAGLEISIVKSSDPNPKKLPPTLCHAGWIGDRYDPLIYDHLHDWDNVEEVIKIACPSFTDNACIVHHLKDCKVWSDYKYLSHFSGMELFNDLGRESSYIYHRDVYLSAQAKGWRGYVIAGADIHNYVAQSGFGKIVTYICSEEFTKEAIEKSIFEGRMIATNNLKIKSLNICPATVTQKIDGDSFEIKATVEIEKSNVPIKHLTIYKDGLYYKSVNLKRRRAVTVMNTEYEFNFSDTLSSSQDHCYILEIYRYMVTSPFCFQKKPLKPDCPVGMVYIPPGSFLMGSSEQEIRDSLNQCNKSMHRSDPNQDCPIDWFSMEGPQHSVSITKGFCMDKYEITRGDFLNFSKKEYYTTEEDFLNGNPTNCRQPDCAVETLGWSETDSYCKSVGKRLPTEAEWEYAARAGTQTRFYWGDQIQGEYLWYVFNSNLNIHPVGQKKPNKFGLYDMIGNAAEWVSDCFDNSWYSNSPSSDPFNNQPKCKERIIRGGYWDANYVYLRSAYRVISKASMRCVGCGGRCVKDIP